MEWLELLVKIKVYEAICGGLAAIILVLFIVLAPIWAFLSERIEERRGICLACHGKGRIWVSFNNRPPCSDCDGTGHSKYWKEKRNGRSD